MYDLFICHSGTDHEKYIEILSTELKNAEISYWVDDEQITCASGILPKAIDAGLLNSKYVLVCIGRDFNNKGFAVSEMYSALYEQISEKARRILPLILDEGENVLSGYPLLKSLVHRKWSDGIPQLITSLKRVL